MQRVGKPERAGAKHVWTSQLPSGRKLVITMYKKLVLDKVVDKPSLEKNVRCHQAMLFQGDAAPKCLTRVAPPPERGPLSVHLHTTDQGPQGMAKRNCKYVVHLVATTSGLGTPDCSEDTPRSQGGKYTNEDIHESGAGRPTAWLAVHAAPPGQGT